MTLLGAAVLAYLQLSDAFQIPGLAVFPTQRHVILLLNFFWAIFCFWIFLQFFFKLFLYFFLAIVFLEWDGRMCEGSTRGNQ